MSTMNVPEGPGSAAVTRRSFYQRAIYGMWGLISTALAVPAIAMLLAPLKKPDSEWIEVADVTRLQPQTPVEMVFYRQRRDAWKTIQEKTTAWVMKQADGQIVAYGPQCTHLGCAYRWNEGRSEFFCPCHSSVFSAEGKVKSGAAPRPLDRFDVVVRNNKVLVGRLQEQKG
jgi:menaquinol-cytochrome c reductase iron-sulfur subunit